MPFILAIQPDAAQAAALQRALRRLANVKIAVVDSKEAALRAIDLEVPDLILLYALMPPNDEEYLGACLAILPDAGHVQTITIPYFDTSSPDRPQSRRLWIGRSEPALLAGCDPKMFASDVFQYLSRARTIKTEIDGRRLRERKLEEERRRAPRWLPTEVPGCRRYNLRLPNGPSCSISRRMVRCSEATIGRAGSRESTRASTSGRGLN